MLENRIIWIDWAFLGRSQNIANRLGVKYYHLDYFSGKPKKIFSYLRYLLASIKTIYLVVFKSPQIVMMTGTPPFPHFIIYYYSKIKKVKYVIDTHGGYFDDSKFQILPGLRKKVLKDAFFHIVTNDVHKNMIEENNGRAIVLGVLIESDDRIKAYKFDNEKSFVWVSSYSPDEPLDLVFDVARRMPEVTIYITGNVKKVPKNFVDRCNGFKNIVLTGFLPTETYISYIKGSTAVIALTTLDNTMQRGAYTALSYNIPIITSNWSLLRNSFSKGTVHIENTSSALEQAIGMICRNQKGYRDEIAELKLTCTREFEEKISAIKDNLATGSFLGDSPR